MDALRREIADFVREEQRLLDRRRAALEARERAGIVRALSLAVAGALAGLIGAALLFLRGRRTEAALARVSVQAEQRAALLRQTYETSPIGLSYHDAATRHVAINERLAAINGRSVEEHIGKRPDEVTPELAPVIVPIFRRVIETGEPLLDVDICIPAGLDATEPRDYRASYWPVKDEAGRVTGVNVAVLDVTERKATERQLAESERRLSVAAEAAGFGTYEWDVKADRHVWSAQTRDIFGVGPTAGINIASFMTMIHPEDRAAVAYEVEAAFARRADIANEYRVVRADGAVRVVINRARVIYADEGAACRPVRLIGAVQDITERRAAEDEVRRLNATLEAEVASRTAELRAANGQLEAFAYTVSHDLRAPLRGMEGFARILMEDFADDLGKQGQHYARRIVGAAERMERLIDDLLTFSRIQRAEVRLQSLDPTRIALAAVEDAAGQSPDACITVDSHLPSVVAEPVVLSHVLSNMLTNAVKFAKPGEQPRVRVGGERMGQRVRIWVEDEGIGIAPEHQERIFNAFERLHGQEAYPGTGIGLAIVKAGVERMGGYAGVDSKTGNGARFWVELAAADMQAAPDYLDDRGPIVERVGNA
jgi:PAS domain S-box-containing protein